MRNTAFVFSGLFFIIHVMLLVSMLLFALAAGLNNIFSESPIATEPFLWFLIVGLGLVHLTAAANMVEHPVRAGLVELVPALFFSVLCLLSGQLLFLTLASPHLLVGAMAIFSADDKNLVEER